MTCRPGADPMIYLKIELNKMRPNKIESLRQYLNKNDILPYTSIEEA